MVVNFYYVTFYVPASVTANIVIPPAVRPSVVLVVLRMVGLGIGKDRVPEMVGYWSTTEFYIACAGG